MTATTTWTVEDIVPNSDGGVFEVKWLCKSTDADHPGKVGSVRDQAFFDPDPTAPGFIAFQDLDEEVVLSWVTSAVDVSAVEQKSLSNLDRAINRIESSLPW